MNQLFSTMATRENWAGTDVEDFPDVCVIRSRDRKLAALKELVANFVHDLNNLLVPMAGYSTLLREHLEPGSAGGAYTERMQSAFGKMDTYLNLVLQATHPERRYSPRSTDLALLLNKKLEAWMKGLPAETQITVQIDLVPCRFALDESQWSLLVQHLLSNAQEALDEGGTLRVMLRRRSLAEAQAAGLGINETNVYQLIFEDTGCGMSEEVMEQACDPFFTTKPHGHAVGLGLTLAHSIVQLHGGQISMESTEGLGTRVCLWLPANVP
jgi:signal transduction histidine kinase